MCVVCDKPQTVEDPTQNMVVAIAERAKGGYLLIVTQDNSGDDSCPESVNIQIKYCPWCGNDIAANRAAIAANTWPLPFLDKNTMK